MLDQSGRIAILTCDDDAHLPFVTRHLDEEPLLINPGRIPDGDHLTYRYWPDQDEEVLWEGEPIGTIRSVWNRRLGVERLRVGLPVAPEHYDYALTSLNQLSFALTQLMPEAFWVSSRLALQRSGYKPHQLKLARRLGLPIPETTITSDPAEAWSFLQKHGACIAKPLIMQPLPGHGQPTRVLQAAERPNLSGLTVNPHIFQELIRPRAELRITVVFPEIFAAEVSTAWTTETESAGIRDSRYATELESGFQATPVSIPSGLAQGCLAMMREYGLVMATFDFIQDEAGIYFFLEMNNNGQWAFIEEVTGQPIGLTVANMLMRAQTPS